MTNIKKLLLCLLIFISSQVLFSQEAITTAQWQEDLRFLQTTVHEDFSFLFKKVSATTFDKEVDILYKEIPSLDSHEIPVAFARIVSLFEYGHTQIPFSNLAMDHVLPINLYHFTDGLYIEGGHKKYTKAIGAKIIAIEGFTIKQALKMIRPVVPAENESFFKAFGVRFLTAPSVLHAQGITKHFKTVITMTLEKDGIQFKQDFDSVPFAEISIAYDLTVPTEAWISARNQNTTPLHLKSLNEKLYYFEYLEDQKTVYARQSKVRDDDTEDLKSFYARMFDFIETHDVDRLIYDVRHNGGGNNFLNTPLITGIIETKKINKKGKFFVVTGRRTFSACQNLVNRLSMYTNALFVGESTAENMNFYGDAKEIMLPHSKISAYLSFAWWQDMAPWENNDALDPDIPVSMSFHDFINNQDPVMNVIMEVDSQSYTIDPMETLTALFINNEYDSFETTLTNWLSYGKYPETDFVSKINDIGIMLTDSGSLDGAQFLLALNSQLYPNKAVVWQSLGNLMIRKKDMPKAKKYLQKASDLDPEGAVGARARAILKGI